MGAGIILATTLLSAGSQYMQQRGEAKAAKKEDKASQRATAKLQADEAKNERQATMRNLRRRAMTGGGDFKPRDTILTSATGVPTQAAGTKTVLGR